MDTQTTAKQVALVTGASSGMGKAFASALLDEGLIVYVAARRIEQMADLAARGAIALKLDTSKPDQIEAAAGQIERDHGGVDVLINNAGLGGSKLLVEMTDDEWNRVIDITLNGTFRMTRAMLKVMQPRGRGVIVNNASVLGWRAQKEQAHYAAAKAGVMALTRCSALEAADFGVRINAVSPSIALHEFLKKSASEELLQKLTSTEAFGRAAEVWEIANVIMFLASDYSSYMTGEIVSVSSQRA